MFGLSALSEVQVAVIGRPLVELAIDGLPSAFLQEGDVMGLPPKPHRELH
jgi:hypothetical protein